MKRHVLDANAIMIHFEGRNGADKVDKVLESARNGGAEIFMSAINVGEVFSSLWKRYGESIARTGVQFIMLSPITIIEADLSGCLAAAELKAKFHAGVGDAFAASLAISKRATLVTADPDFRKFGDKIKILWLPSHKSVN